MLLVRCHITILNRDLYICRVTTSNKQYLSITIRIKTIFINNKHFLCITKSQFLSYQIWKVFIQWYSLVSPYEFFLLYRTIEQIGHVMDTIF